MTLPLLDRPDEAPARKLRFGPSTGGSALVLQVASLFALPRPETSVLAEVLALLRRTVDGPT